MIRIRLAANSVGEVSFAMSPLLECVLSLHVLAGPKHHVLRHAWVRTTRHSLPAELKGRIGAFAFLYRHQIPDVVGPRGGDGTPAFADELAAVSAYPPELLLEEFGRPLFDHGGRHGEGVFDEPRVRDTMRRRAAVDGPSSLRLVDLLLEDPAEFAREFAKLLQDYWESVFFAEWKRVEPMLSESVDESRRLLGVVGTWPALGRLPPHCRVDAQRQELQIDIPHEHAVVVSAENPLVLSPSVFVWPHVRVNCDPPWPTAVVYVAPALARTTEPRIPPTELLDILRALADDTRLRVLRLIAEQPRTTQELAPLVGLSTAGLSKSLRRLADAGLVTARREGYYVVYSLAQERLAALSMAITQFLDEHDD